VIRAPVNGVVLARRVEPGQTVVANFNTVTLFVIAEDLSQMQLRVSVDEADVGQVKPGQKATFTVDAYPGRRFPATLERVDLASSSTTQAQAGGASAGAGAGGSVVNYEARLTVANAEGLLRPGMTATATIATQNTGRALLVPNAALRFRPDVEEESSGGVFQPQIGLEDSKQQASIGEGSRQQVQVLQPDGSLKAIEVITGRSDGRRTVVRSKQLKPGMKVVTGIKAAAK
jgi:HlyD family secretion protein